MEDRVGKAARANPFFDLSLGPERRHAGVVRCDVRGHQYDTSYAFGLAGIEQVCITDALDFRESAGAAGYNHVGCGEDRGDSAGGDGEAVSISQLPNASSTSLAGNFSVSPAAPAPERSVPCPRAGRGRRSQLTGCTDDEYQSHFCSRGGTTNYAFRDGPGIRNRRNRDLSAGHGIDRLGLDGTDFG